MESLQRVHERIQGARPDPAVQGNREARTIPPACHIQRLWFARKLIEQAALSSPTYKQHPEGLEFKIRDPRLGFLEDEEH